MKKTILTLACLVVFGTLSSAQDAAIKTNLAKDATLSFDAGVEAALSEQWTLDISGSYNPWTLENNRKWKHWMVQPELRYWGCQKFNGWFVGLHAQGGQYNMGRIPVFKLKDTRAEGWFAGAGVGLGYQWILSRHLNLEAELGAGYNYTRYDRYRCAECGKKLTEDHPYDYWGVTKAVLGLV